MSEPAVSVGAGDVRAMTAVLATATGPVDDAERVDLLRALEELTCAAQGLQAVVTTDLDTSQRAAQTAAGVRPERIGQGIAAQVALARRESPHRGQRHVGLARVLRTEMPHTLVALRAGAITEWKATLLARETACLTLPHRRAVDTEIAADPDRVAAMGDRELETAARRAAYRLDPASVVERRRRAEADRRVTLRPAPDVMTQLTALLPVKHGVAVIATLSKAADSAVAAGDQRTRGQVMADTLVERVVGGAAPAGQPAVTVDLVVSDRVLLGDDAEPAWLDGYGDVPADLAREIVAAAAGRAALRRLYAEPTGHLVAMDARARLFPTALATYIRLRDRTCRTPVRRPDPPRRPRGGRPRTAAPPAPPTARGSARPATTPRAPPTGPPDPEPDPATPSGPPPPPATRTPPPPLPRSHRRWSSRTGGVQR